MFICKANAERSQIAEMLFNDFSRKNHAFSAGTRITQKELKFPPGRVVSELLLDLGYESILKKKRQRLTKALADKAGRIIVLLTRKEREALPSYVSRSKKTTYWDISYIPNHVYASYPPPTYYYHMQVLLRIRTLVGELIKELEQG